MTPTKTPWTDEFIDLPVEEIRRRVNSYVALVGAITEYSEAKVAFDLDRLKEDLNWQTRYARLTAAEQALLTLAKETTL